MPCRGCRPGIDELELLLLPRHAPRDRAAKEPIPHLTLSKLYKILRHMLPCVLTNRAMVMFCFNKMQYHKCSMLNEGKKFRKSHVYNVPATLFQNFAQTARPASRAASQLQLCWVRPHTRPRYRRVPAPSLLWSPLSPSHSRPEAVGYGLGKTRSHQRPRARTRTESSRSRLYMWIFFIFNDNVTDGGIPCAGNKKSCRHYFCWALRKWAIGPALARDSVTSTQLDPKIYPHNQRKF